MKSQVLQGNNIDVLRTFPDNHFDSIVTDPPYGIDFLGKAWDANTGALETYQECLRVLKPGGHILAFSAARTYHHLAVTIEQTGFEIRDQIMWIYSSGFPKSQDVGKALDKKGIDNEWAGWGTQLKPAHEPICLARKPLHKSNSIAKNCQEWGVGAINIDASRIEGLTESELNWTPQRQHTTASISIGGAKPGDEQSMYNDKGRFPSNVIGEIAESYQKYFYCPKVSRRERHIGHDESTAPTEQSMLDAMGGYYIDHTGQRQSITGKQVWLPQTGGIYVHGLKEEYRKWCEANDLTPVLGNNHPTVKPIELMKYLIKLITPAGGRVLDPFNGSGSTGCAAVELDYDYTGIELDPKYVDIATKRITAWYRATHNANFDQVFDIDD